MDKKELLLTEKEVPFASPSFSVFLFNCLVFFASVSHISVRLCILYSSVRKSFNGARILEFLTDPLPVGPVVL